MRDSKLIPTTAESFETGRFQGLLEAMREIQDVRKVMGDSDYLSGYIQGRIVALESRLNLKLVSKRDYEA